MADDPRTAEQVRSAAAELASRHLGDRSTRAAFLERAIEAVDRMARAAEDGTLRDALDVNTDTAVLSALGLTRNGKAAPYAAADPLAAAKARGEQAKRDILTAQGEMLDADAVAKRLGCDLAEVQERQRTGLLIALPDERGKPRYPAWQFTDAGLLPGLEDVLRSLTAPDPWSRVQFLQSGDPYLNGQIPLDLIRRGEIDIVRRLAAAYDELVAT